MQKRFGGGVTFVAQVIQKQASPGAVLHVVIELGVVSLMGLVQIRLVVEERPDGDENGVAVHAEGPRLARPRAQDAQAYFAFGIEVGVDSGARVLHELDRGRDHGVVVGNVEVQLDQLVPVKAVFGAHDVGVEAEEVVVVEKGKVVLVLRL